MQNDMIITNQMCNEFNEFTGAARILRPEGAKCGVAFVKFVKFVVEKRTMRSQKNLFNPFNPWL